MVYDGWPGSTLNPRHLLKKAPCCIPNGLLFCCHVKNRQMETSESPLLLKERLLGMTMPIAEYPLHHVLGQGNVSFPCTLIAQQWTSIWSQVGLDFFMAQLKESFHTTSFGITQE